MKATDPHFPIKPMDGCCVVRLTELRGKGDNYDYSTVGEAVVLAVGEGEMLHDGQRKIVKFYIGDTILFEYFARLEKTIGGQEYILLRHADVLGVLNGK